MKLNIASLKNKSDWQDFKLPKFDIENTIENTEKTPKWIHFGAGNIFRGFIARINQTLLENGLTDTGIIAVDTSSTNYIDKIYKPFDNLTMLVKLKSDGNMKKEVIAGISKSIKITDELELLQIFKNPSLQIISFTITEKGYSLYDKEGFFLEKISKDIKNGPKNATHVMSVVCANLNERFLENATPITVLSMDNCSHNGDKLKSSIITLAKEWEKLGFVSSGFINYLDEKCSFPCSMIDKITPRPSFEISNMLKDLGLSDMDLIDTGKGSFIAPFVNAEMPEYLVIEDNFLNGRPNFNDRSVFLTDRHTVENVETMKVTTCLNPLHTALAVFGCILGYTRIYEEMKNPLLLKLCEEIGFNEGLPVVCDPKIINPKVFLEEVIYERFNNPFVPDEPQRIASDTSQKVGIRFGETIKSYINDHSKDVLTLTFIPLAIAGWLRYLLGVDDNGNDFTLSPDPLLDDLTSKLSSISLGSSYNGEALKILEEVFGSYIIECGLSLKIEEMFKELIEGKGAVLKTLEKYCG